MSYINTGTCGSIYVELQCLISYANEESLALNINLTYIAALNKTPIVS